DLRVGEVEVSDLRVEARPGADGDAVLAAGQRVRFADVPPGTVIEVQGGVATDEDAVRGVAGDTVAGERVGDALHREVVHVDRRAVTDLDEVANGVGGRDALRLAEQRARLGEDRL